MKRFLQSGLIICAGIMGMANASIQPEQDITTDRKKFDLRETILRKFLKDKHCPVQDYAPSFVSEADIHGLDWRLLPSISIVESGCGKTSKGNNLFGWANGHRTFSSIGDAIHQVAFALAHGKPYKGKDLNGKLAAYNKGPDYRSMVLDIMSQIAPSPQIEVTE